MLHLRLHHFSLASQSCSVDDIIIIYKSRKIYKGLNYKFLCIVQYNNIPFACTNVQYSSNIQLNISQNIENVINTIDLKVNFKSILYFFCLIFWQHASTHMKMIFNKKGVLFVIVSYFFFKSVLARTRTKRLPTWDVRLHIFF